MIIAVSSKEKKRDTIEALTERGHVCVEFDICTADFQRYGLPGGVRVERKQDVSELVKSFIGSSRYNTEKENHRAESDGTPLYYVISENKTQSNVEINDIFDVLDIDSTDLRSVNRHEDIQGAVEMMDFIKNKYGTKFIFTTKEEITDVIEDLLERQPGTVYEKS